MTELPPGLIAFFGVVYTVTIAEVALLVASIAPLQGSLDRIVAAEARFHGRLEELYRRHGGPWIVQVGSRYIRLRLYLQSLRRIVIGGVVFSVLGIVLHILSDALLIWGPRWWVLDSLVRGVLTVWLFLGLLVNSFALILAVIQRGRIAPEAEPD